MLLRSVTGGLASRILDLTRQLMLPFSIPISY